MGWEVPAADWHTTGLPAATPRDPPVADPVVTRLEIQPEIADCRGRVRLAQLQERATGALFLPPASCAALPAGGYRRDLFKHKTQTHLRTYSKMHFDAARFFQEGEIVGAVFFPSNSSTAAKK